MTLNILWLSHLLPYPPIGGVRQRSYYLLREVAKKNRVTVLALSQKAHQSNEDKINKSVHRLLSFCDKVYCNRIPCDRNDLGKIILHIFSFFTGSCYLSNWVKSDYIKTTLNQIVKKNRFDIVYFDSIALAQYCKLLPAIPTVLNHHNIESQLMLRRAQTEKNILTKVYCCQESFKRKILEKKFCLKFDLNICVSELDKIRIKKIIPVIGKVEVVRNGVDPDRLWPPQFGKKDAKSLLFTGGMTRFPNRDAMIYFAMEIWPILKKEVHGIKMTVVGREPPEFLRTLSQKDPNFILTGFVDDIKPYYDATCVYVCPIRDGGGTRLKVLDAMSAGKAIVSTPLCAEGIEVEDGREILIARSIDDFVYHIKKLLQDDKLREFIETNARKFVVEKYNFSNIGEELNNFFENVVLHR